MAHTLYSEVLLIRYSLDWQKVFSIENLTKICTSRLNPKISGFVLHCKLVLMRLNLEGVVVAELLLMKIGMKYISCDFNEQVKIKMSDHRSLCHQNYFKLSFIVVQVLSFCIDASFGSSIYIAFKRFYIVFLINKVVLLKFQLDFWVYFLLTSVKIL